eukprot:TRINITY_DN16812_c0_g1_i1.p1 TRINITY_DN16812_c0_g1~~TRINITY_DN16812_c0_g1_i1.p1  ORF type:complete len:308 (+),score=55.61 TRINITY_DN16812_c0_g1_i1:490-1413(+)
MARELMIASRFKVIGKIGGGSFGDIYEGYDTKRKEPVAIKLEKAMNKNPMLKYEANVLKLLNKGKRAPGIPEMHYSGSEGEFEVMVITLCGPSLEDLNNYCCQRLSTGTVCMIADQILCRLEYLHTKNFIHRDLKPENFVMGIGPRAHCIYMIDYGLAKRYCDPKTLQHVPHTTGKPLVGTTRYASVNAHLGIEQSRRDDLEGLGMVLVYLALSSLPWQGMQANTRAEKERKIMEKKIMSKPSVLCASLPKCFEQYLTYARSLKYEQEPDYQYCRKIFSDEHSRRTGTSYTWTYDWDVMFKQRRYCW